MISSLFKPRHSATSVAEEILNRLEKRCEERAATQRAEEETTVELPPDLLARIDRLAEHEHRSRTSFIASRLEQLATEHEAREAEKPFKKRGDPRA